MLIRAPKDFWSGIMFLCFAGVALYASSFYSMGRGGRMGPGYFPTLLGAVLAILGLILVVRSLVIRGDALEKMGWRPLLALVACVLLFAAMIQPLGLVIALSTTTFLASFAGPDWRLREAIFLSAGLTLAAVLIFVLGLRLPLPLWPSL